MPTELTRRILPPQVRSYNFFGMLRLWRLHRVSTLFTEYVLLSIDIHRFEIVAYS
jgi:hypothetical protein